MKKDNKIDDELYRIKVDGRQLEFHLKRSSRRTIGIKIDKYGEVTVSSPLRISEAYLYQLILQKAAWIFEKVEQMKSKAHRTERIISFEQGETLKFLGKAYRLKLQQASGIAKPEINLEEDCFIIRYSEYNKGQFEVLLRNWYVRQFAEFIEQSIERYSKILGVHPKRAAIKDQRTRWGSCSAKGNINLNWRLIMAPNEIIDYVIVHELCHMREMNHSPKFWKLVESIIPSYKDNRKWLKENGDSLVCNINNQINQKL